MPVGKVDLPGGRLNGLHRNFDTGLGRGTCDVQCMIGDML